MTALFPSLLDLTKRARKEMPNQPEEVYQAMAVLAQAWLEIEPAATIHTVRSLAVHYLMSGPIK